MNTKQSGTLFVISAPSGAGKTSLANKLIELMDQVERSISHTTRSIRPGEIEGTDYFFVTKAEFDRMLVSGEFLEYAEIFGNQYGTSQVQIRERLQSGIDLLLTIDWQGARQVCKLFPDAVSIFVLPPSLSTLKARLQGRQQDHDHVIQKRLEGVSEEVSHYDEFDYLVVNNVLDEALLDLQSIICATRLKRARQALKHAGLLAELLNKR